MTESIDLTTLSKTELEQKKEALTRQLNDINHQLKYIETLEKPYVACISSYSGGGQMAFKTETQARKKLEEYYGKKRFRNGLSYGVYLYRHNPDKTITLLEFRPMARKDFYPSEFIIKDETINDGILVDTVPNPFL